MVDQAEYIFTFAPAIGTGVDRIHILAMHEFIDDLELFLGTGVVDDFIFIFPGDDRQMFNPPLFVGWVIGLREGHGHQMSIAPANDGLPILSIAAVPIGFGYF